MTQKTPPRKYTPRTGSDHDASKKEFSPRRDREHRDGDATDRPRRFSPGPGRDHNGGDRPFPPRHNGNTDDRPRRFSPDRNHNREDRPFRPRPDGNTDDRPRRFGPDRNHNREDRPFRPRPDGNTDDRPRRFGPDRNHNREDRPFRPRPDGNTDDRPRRFTPDRDHSREDRPFRPRYDDGNTERPRRSPFPEQSGNRNVKLRPRKNKQAADEKPTRTRSMPEFVTDEMRLNKFISNSGICSRREADEFIAAGLVTVNGEVVTKMGVRVKSTDDVRFNGERLQGEQKVYIVMNKPKDFVTTTDDPHAEKTVMDLVAGQCEQRVYPVGRLDKSTTGVLLLTNDGGLTEQLTHPSYNRKKIYQVDLDKNLKQSDMELLIKGIELEDGVAHLDEISYIDENEKKIGVEIHSGRNRIIRRMFEHLGYSVKKLDRVYFAGLTKKKLRRGAWRFLTPQEVAMLKMGSYE